VVAGGWSVGDEPGASFVDAAAREQQLALLAHDHIPAGAVALGVAQLARLHALALAESPDGFAGRWLTRRPGSALGRVEGFLGHQSRSRSSWTGPSASQALYDWGCDCVTV